MSHHLQHPTPDMPDANFARTALAYAYCHAYTIAAERTADSLQSQTTSAAGILLQVHIQIANNTIYRPDACKHVQGRSIRGGDSGIAGAPAPSLGSADLSINDFSPLRGWDLAATPSESPAADWFAKALSEFANTEASNSHVVAAPGPSVVTAPGVSAPPPSSPAAAAVAPPPARKRTCPSNQVCTLYTYKDGSTDERCNPQPDFPSNRVNLCPDEMFALCFFGPLLLLALCVLVYSGARECCARQEEKKKAVKIQQGASPS